MERAVLFCQGAILEANNFPSDLQDANRPMVSYLADAPRPASIPSDPATVEISFRIGEQSLNDLEDRIITEVRRRSEGNKTLAAKHLNIAHWMLGRRRKN